MNALNAQWTGKALDTLAALPAPDAAPSALTSSTARSLYAAIAESVLHVARVAANDERIVIEGASEILRQPEFQDIAKIEGVIDTLQTKARVFEIVARGPFDLETMVIIGTENRVEALHECSVITAPYYIGTRERGTLGVVGPTRMDYDKTMPAVSFMARNLSELLSRLS